MISGVSHITNFLIRIIAVTAMICLPSCQLINEPEHQDSEEGAVLYLNLTVVAQSETLTRADHDDDYEEEGKIAENYIDIQNDDLRILLYTRNGQFILELSDIDWESSVEEDRIIYKLKDKQIPIPNTTDEEREIVEDIRSNGITVLAIANSKNAGSSPVTSWPELTELWGNGNNMNFSYFTSQPGSMTWQPDISSTPKKLIPMFGMVGVKFSNITFGVSKSMGTIYMQRAMAKIEVIDNLSDKGFEITDVTMSDYNSNGRVIPNLILNPDWNVFGSQNGVSSLPQNVGTVTNGLTLFRMPAEKKWIAYVPEMALTPILNDDRTHLNVGIQPNGNSEAKETYTIHFAKYNEQFIPTIPDNSWNHILRNHIYRFSVNNVGFSVDLHLHVLPWMLDNEEEWNFTDQVTVQQTLEWTKDSYSSYNEETGEVVLKLETNEILEGSFIISSPINGRYYARITPLEGAKPGAISFVDSEGKILEPSSGTPLHCHEITGVIEEERPYRIYIMATDLGADEQSSFRLDFYVENLGTWINVPMSKNDNFQYFTIIRPGTQLQ